MGMADPVVEAEEVRPGKVPDPPRRPVSINDNYCILDPVLMVWPMKFVEGVKDENVSVVAAVNVSCPVVSPVLSAINISRLSEKKGVSPLSEPKKELKFVKNFLLQVIVFSPNCSQCPQYF